VRARSGKFDTVYMAKEYFKKANLTFAVIKSPDVEKARKDLAKLEAVRD
jgi:hypothetical protein